VNSRTVPPGYTEFRPAKSPTSPAASNTVAAGAASQPANITALEQQQVPKVRTPIKSPSTTEWSPTPRAAPHHASAHHAKSPPLPSKTSGAAPTNPVFDEAIKTYSAESVAPADPAVIVAQRPPLPVPSTAPFIDVAIMTVGKQQATVSNQPPIATTPQILDDPAIKLQQTAAQSKLYSLLSGKSKGISAGPPANNEGLKPILTAKSDTSALDSIFTPRIPSVDKQSSSVEPASKAEKPVAKACLMYDMATLRALRESPFCAEKSPALVQCIAHRKKRYGIILLLFFNL
jgi:hypothetical protein